MTTERVIDFQGAGFYIGETTMLSHNAVSVNNDKSSSRDTGLYARVDVVSKHHLQCF